MQVSERGDLACPLTYRFVGAEAFAQSGRVQFGDFASIAGIQRVSAGIG
jgi:hypothetical protein